MEAPRSLVGLSVPWLEKPAQPYNGPFRNNILAFLKSHAISKLPLQSQGLRKVTAYVLRLVHLNKEDGSQQQTLLHVYEERVTEDSSPICDQCRNMGWQHHPVCNRKFHFIIPGYAVLADPNQLPAKVEALVSSQGPASSLVSSLNLSQLSIEADEDTTPYNAPATVFDSTLHCLHGVLHSNGYGHLLRINGRDGACGPLTGTQLVSVWDALCSLLGAQQVSVEDVSNKSGMLLRVLHGAAYLKTWYGKWGYEFGRACYNISQEEYLAALHAVHQAPLQDILKDCAHVNQELCDILQRYASEADVPAHSKQQQQLTNGTASVLQLEPAPAVSDGDHAANGHHQQPQHPPVSNNTQTDEAIGAGGSADTDQADTDKAADGRQDCPTAEPGAQAVDDAVAEQQATAAVVPGVQVQQQQDPKHNSASADTDAVAAQQQGDCGHSSAATEFGAVDADMQDTGAGKQPTGSPAAAVNSIGKQTAVSAAAAVTSMDCEPPAQSVVDAPAQLPPTGDGQPQVLPKECGPAQQPMDIDDVAGADQPVGEHKQGEAHNAHDAHMAATNSPVCKQEGSPAMEDTAMHVQQPDMIAAEEGKSIAPDTSASPPPVTEAGSPIALAHSVGQAMQSVDQKGTQQDAAGQSVPAAHAMSALADTTLGQVLQRMLKQLASLPPPAPPPLIQPILPTAPVLTPCPQPLPATAKAAGGSKAGKTAKTGGKRPQSARADSRMNSQQLFTPPARGDASGRMAVGRFSAGAELQQPGSEAGTTHMPQLRTSRRVNRGRRSPPPPDVADLPAQQLQGSSTVPVHCTRGASKRMSNSGTEYLLKYMQRSHAAATADCAAAASPLEAVGNTASNPVDGEDANVVDNASKPAARASRPRAARAAAALSYKMDPDGGFVLPEISPPPDQLPPLRLTQLAGIAGRHGSVQRLQRVLLTTMQVLKACAVGRWVRRDAVMEAMAVAGFKSQGTCRDVLQLLCGHKLGGWAAYRLAGFGTKCQTQFRVEPACEHPLDPNTTSLEQMFDHDNPQSADAVQQQPAEVMQQQSAEAVQQQTAEAGQQPSAAVMPPQHAEVPPKQPSAVSNDMDLSNDMDPATVGSAAAGVDTTASEMVCEQGQQQHQQEQQPVAGFDCAEQRAVNSQQLPGETADADMQEQQCHAQEDKQQPSVPEEGAGITEQAPAPSTSASQQAIAAAAPSKTSSQKASAAAARSKATSQQAAAAAALGQARKAVPKHIPKPDPTSLFEAAVAAAAAESLISPTGRPARHVARSTARALLGMRSSKHFSGGGAAGGGAAEGLLQATAGGTSSTQQSKKRPRKSPSVEHLSAPSEPIQLAALPAPQEEVAGMVADQCEPSTAPVVEPLQPAAPLLGPSPLPHSPLKRQRSKHTHIGLGGVSKEHVAVTLKVLEDGLLAVNVKVQTTTAARQNLLQLLQATPPQPAEGPEAAGMQQQEVQEGAQILDSNGQVPIVEVPAHPQMSDEQHATGTASVMCGEAALLTLSEVTGKGGAVAITGATHHAEPSLYEGQVQPQHVSPDPCQQVLAPQPCPETSTTPCQGALQHDTAAAHPQHGTAAHCGEPQHDTVAHFGAEQPSTGPAQLSALGGGPFSWGHHACRSPRKLRLGAQGTKHMFMDEHPHQASVSHSTATDAACTAATVAATHHRPDVAGNSMQAEPTSGADIAAGIGPSVQLQHVHSHEEPAEPEPAPCTSMFPAAAPPQSMTNEPGEAMQGPMDYPPQTSADSPHHKLGASPHDKPGSSPCQEPGGAPPHKPGTSPPHTIIAAGHSQWPEQMTLGIVTSDAVAATTDNHAQELIPSLGSSSQHTPACEEVCASLGTSPSLNAVPGIVVSGREGTATAPCDTELSPAAATTAPSDMDVSPIAAEPAAEDDAAAAAPAVTAVNDVAQAAPALTAVVDTAAPAPAGIAVDDTTEQAPALTLVDDAPEAACTQAMAQVAQEPVPAAAAVENAVAKVSSEPAAALDNLDQASKQAAKQAVEGDAGAGSGDAAQAVSPAAVVQNPPPLAPDVVATQHDQAVLQAELVQAAAQEDTGGVSAAADIAAQPSVTAQSTPPSPLPGTNLSQAADLPTAGVPAAPVEGVALGAASQVADIPTANVAGVFQEGTAEPHLLGAKTVPLELGDSMVIDALGDAIEDTLQANPQDAVTTEPAVQAEPAAEQAQPAGPAAATCADTGTRPDQDAIAPAAASDADAAPLPAQDVTTPAVAEGMGPEQAVGLPHSLAVGLPQSNGPLPPPDHSQGNTIMDEQHHVAQPPGNVVQEAVVYRVGSASPAYKQVPAVAIEATLAPVAKKARLVGPSSPKPYLAPLIVMADVESRMALCNSTALLQRGSSMQGHTLSVGPVLGLGEDTLQDPAGVLLPAAAAAAINLNKSRAARCKRKRDTTVLANTAKASNADSLVMAGMPAPSNGDLQLHSNADVGGDEPPAKHVKTHAHGSTEPFHSTVVHSAQGAAGSDMQAGTSAPAASTKVKIRVKGLGKQRTTAVQAAQLQALTEPPQGPSDGAAAEDGLTAAAVAPPHILMPQQEAQAKSKKSKSKLKHPKLEHPAAPSKVLPTAEAPVEVQPVVPPPPPQQQQRTKQTKQSKQLKPQKQQQQPKQEAQAAETQHLAALAVHASRPARVRRPTAYAQDYVLDDEPAAQAVVVKPEPVVMRVQLGPVVKDDAAAADAAVRTSGRAKKPRKLSSSPEPPPMQTALKSSGKAVKLKSRHSCDQVPEAVHGHVSCNGHVEHHAHGGHAVPDHSASKSVRSTASLQQRPRCSALPLWYLSAALGKASTHDTDAAHPDHAAQPCDTVAGAVSAPDGSQALLSPPDWRTAQHSETPAGPSTTSGQAHPALLNNEYTRLLADLQTVYNCLLRHYQPVLAALKHAALPMDATLATAQLVVDGTPLRLPNMAGCLQVLKDSRYFVKDYGGPMRHAPPPDTLRLLCQVQLPASMVTVFPLPEGATPSAVQLLRKGITPAEPVVVPYRASISDVRRLASDALSDVYRLFRPRTGVSEFRITAVLQGLPAACQSLGPEALDHVRIMPASNAATDQQPVDTRVRPRGRAAAATMGDGAAADKSAVWAAEDGACVVLSASGMDPDMKWVHAGGPEDWQVYCNVCGTQDDDGERMIACDCCTRWVHTRCYEIPEEAEDPATFVCDLCCGSQ